MNSGNGLVATIWWWLGLNTVEANPRALLLVKTPSITYVRRCRKENHERPRGVARAILLNATHPSERATAADTHSAHMVSRADNVSTAKAMCSIDQSLQQAQT